METTWKAGLEDVVAARSAVCTIDGAAGRLYYRGYEIGDLAGAVPFEDVVHLLWFGELPSAGQAREFRARLRAARELPPAVVALLHGLPADCHPLDALRSAVSMAAALDPDVKATDSEANLRKALRLTTLVPATVAAWHRQRTGRQPVPAPSLRICPYESIQMVSRDGDQEKRIAAVARKAVNCDLCAYRAPWPGREGRQGQPIGVGHSHLAAEHLGASPVSPENLGASPASPEHHH